MYWFFLEYHKSNLYGSLKQKKNIFLYTSFSLGKMYATNLRHTNNVKSEIYVRYLFALLDNKIIFWINSSKASWWLFSFSRVSPLSFSVHNTIYSQFLTFVQYNKITVALCYNFIL